VTFFSRRGTRPASLKAAVDVRRGWHARAEVPQLTFAEAGMRARRCRS
jgi:hypothetical protein